MGAQFEYDEKGSTFYFFVVAFYAIILLPATYYLWPSSGKKDESKTRDRCRCDGCEEKIDQKKAGEPFVRVRMILTCLGLLIGWILFILLVYKVMHIEIEDETYDPYTELQIDRGATEKEITKKYRKWSKIHHPDRGGDPKKFIAIAKAYQALTNEESRENWEKHGNPDGPGATTFGIALPKWIVSKEYGTWVLLGYGFMLVVVLPTIVGVWWYNSIKYSAEQVLLDTTQLYYIMLHKTPNLILRRVIMLLAGSFEFYNKYNKEIVERPSDDKELPLLMKELPNLGEKNKERPLCMPYSLKARVILHAHLSRIPLPKDSLDKDRCYILRKCPSLMQEMLQVSHQLMLMLNVGRAARAPNVDSVERMIKVTSMIVQAIWENKSPLLQLPHFTDDMLRYCITKKRRVKSCSDVASLNAEERRSLFRTMTDAQYADVVVVLKMMPRISVDTRVEVQGEDDKETVTAKSFVTMYVTLTRSALVNDDDTDAPQCSNSVDGDEKEDMDDEEASVCGGGGGDEDANQADGGAGQTTVRQRKPWEKQQQKKKKGGKKQAPPAKKKVVTPVVSSATAAGAAQPPKDTADSPSSKSRPKHARKKAGDDSDDSGDVDASASGSEDSEAEDDEHKENNKKETTAEDDDDLVFDDSFAKKEMTLETKSKITHPVHCPYFPEDKYEWWWVYMCDRKRKALVAGPVLLSTLITTEEVELKFAAPPKAGTYTYQVCVRSDSYVDAEYNKDIKLVVDEAREAPTSHPQWDFPSDDEDGAAAGAGGHSDDSRHSDASEYTEGEEDDDD